MEEIRTLMEDAIRTQLQDLSTHESGSDAQTAAVKNLVALYELKISEDKVQMEAEDKQEAHAAARAEFAQRESQADEQKITHRIQIGVAIAEIVLPLVCYGRWFNKGLKFEETGSITSSMMRNLIGKFKLKK